MKRSTYIVTGMILLLVVLFRIDGLATKWVVTVQNFVFTPSSLPNVIVGDTIRWEWINGTHTTTSTSIPAGAATWDSPIDATNQTFEYPVTIAGTYNYHCMHHPTVMIASFTATGTTPTLVVLPSNQNVNPSAGSTVFNVTSNSDWTAMSNATWCTVTPSGSGNGPITAAYAQNTTGLPRIDTITVNVTGLSPVRVTVSQDAATGIGEHSSIPLQVYPNPSSGNLNIVLDDASDIAQDVTIIDMTGCPVFSKTFNGKNEIRLDLGTMPDGFYFVRIRTNNGFRTQRFVIEH